MSANFENLQEELEAFIEDEGRDIKYKYGDLLLPINFDCTPSISYDYLLIDARNEYSFLNEEINKATSEEFPSLSDAQIYFQKINKICSSNINVLANGEKFFELLRSPNKYLKEIAESIFSQKLTAEQTPSFIEIRLYTNKGNNKAPRVFGFIGNMNIIYILCYDPFHKVYNKTGKI